MLDLEKKTLIELKKLAKENNIKNISKLKKEELITILDQILPKTIQSADIEEIDFSDILEQEDKKIIMEKQYDKNGEPIHSELDERIIGVTLEELKEIPLKIGVAYGEHKVQSIKAGLRGHLIDVLITDRETAEKLI